MRMINSFVRQQFRRVPTSPVLTLRKILALTMVLSFGAPSNVFADNIPGKHGTLNHYAVAMNGGWHKNGDRLIGVYHWIKIDFRMSDTGDIEAPVTLETDSMNGFCGSVQVQIRGDSNELLDAFNSNTFCIGGKPGGQAIRSRPIPWSMKTSPANAAAYRHLYIIPNSYEKRDWLDIGKVFELIQGALTVIQML